MSQERTKARPNVLLISTDHLSGRLLGCAGRQTVMTPTIDQFARWGTRFTNAYSACPSVTYDRH
ncbi:MAG: sulfatase-like hydrolase/transferase [Spirochaetales bacterium]|nr:sulfatase-like hydrolase/transferase [Spirochaetales bacterium]